jgi:hypothetical protein
MKAVSFILFSVIVSFNGFGQSISLSNSEYKVEAVYLIIYEDLQSQYSHTMELKNSDFVAMIHDGYESFMNPGKLGNAKMLLKKVNNSELPYGDFSIKVKKLFDHYYQINDTDFVLKINSSVYTFNDYILVNEFGFPKIIEMK